MAERLLFTSITPTLRSLRLMAWGQLNITKKKKNAEHIIFEFTGLRLNEETDCLILVKLVFSKKD